MTHHHTESPAMETRKTIIFTAPRHIEIAREAAPQPGEGLVLVKSIISAISPGTEMLVYRGQFPNMALDSGITGMQNQFAYPLAYGYACVGEVIALGNHVSPHWLGKKVFSFQPHSSCFTASPSALLPIPADVPVEDACFFPNVETAVNIVHDAAPLLGENALVLGQGIVGLLVTALLRQFPLHALLCADLHPLRRSAAQALGANLALNPADPGFTTQARQGLHGGADLVIEVSGAPDALNSAIDLCTFSGRIIIGSWYGEKRAPIDLGGSFHRSRIKIISSQVSTISPELSGRWTKERRYQAAWQALAHIQPQKWITHRFSVDEAARAYQLVDASPQDVIQAVFYY